MKVAIMVSCSRTSRVTSAQRGLMCPIRHEHPCKSIAMNDDSYPKLEKSKEESERYSSMTLINFKLKEAW